MALQDNRQHILDFFAAFYAKDLDRSLSFYDDTIDYVSFAPVDIMPYLGHRSTKQQIRETFGNVFLRYGEMRYEVLLSLAENDRVATINRVFLRKRNRDRIVQFDMASFFTLRDGLIVQEREFLDSYDLVQQVLEVDIASKLKSSDDD